MSLPRMRLARAPLAMVLGSLAISACAHNTAIGRDQLILVSDDDVEALANTSWSQINETMPESREPEDLARLNRVSNRVLRAVGASPQDWEFKLFVSDDLNAFALPGGKVGMTTGMMAFCRNDDELAAILGHEIAHVELHHSAERISRQMATEGLIDLTGGKTSGLLEIGATLGVILPFSRVQELEADRLGLRYMHRAGYRPQAAVDLWTRMLAAQSGPQAPDWLSTHPAKATRIEALEREVARLRLEPVS